MRLEPLPGQAPRTRYEVIWNTGFEPVGSLGYLVRHTRLRHAQIIACLFEDGTVHAGDGTPGLDGEPLPGIALMQRGDDDDGTVARYDVSAETMVEAATYRHLPADLYGFTHFACDLGPYEDSFLDLRRFLSVAYLAFVHIPGLGTEPCTRALARSELIAVFFEQSLPDALETVLRHADEPHASRFERYAASLIGRLDVERIRQVMASAPVSLARLTTTGLAFIRTPANLGREDRDLLIETESMINRLILMSRRLGSTTNRKPPTHARPILPLLSKPGPEDTGFAGFSALDWSTIDSIAILAPGLLARQDTAPADSRFLGASARQGGEWDVRVRFATLCEGLPLPFRMDYRFDCDVANGTFEVHLTTPQLHMFPPTRWDDRRRRWTAMGEAGSALHTAYTIRLILLATAAAFGAGLGIREASVTAYDDGFSQPIASFAFERVGFINGPLSRRVLARIADPNAWTDIPALISMIGAVDGFFDLSDSFGLRKIPARPTVRDRRRMRMQHDGRVLSRELGELLCADHVLDLDIFHDGSTENGGHSHGKASPVDQMKMVRAAEVTALTSPLLAIASLEQTASEIPVPQGPDGSPLYCATMPGRVLAAVTREDPSRRFKRYPDARFSAMIDLAQLYLRVGDTRRAVDMSKACIEIAPTTPEAYIAAGDALVAIEDFESAAEFYEKARRFVVFPQDCAFLDYRYAFALWMLGRHDVALALYTSALQIPGMHTLHAYSELHQLMASLGQYEEIPPETAESTLRRNGIEPTPLDETLAIVAQVAVRLVEEQMFTPAALLIDALSDAVRDDVISVVGASVENGVGEPSR